MRTQPANPFFATRLQVVELARRRYFEDGVPPGGAVSDAVFQSWARCQRLHEGPEGRVEFQPVTLSRTHLALQRNRALHQAWLAELPSLQMLLGTTSCAAMLTDGSGVLIGASCAGRPHEQLLPVATRLGVDLSEEAVGTTAPGVVVRTGQPVCVLGAEHFFDGVRQMHCAAVPIHDTQGRLAGVLDISSESIAFGFDAASVVGHLASAIENRLLLAQAGDRLVLRLQVAPSLLDSSVVGLVGIDPDGRVAWLNGIASRLLGVPARDPGTLAPAVEAVFGLSFGRLASLPRQGAAVVPLANGLAVWVRATLADAVTGFPGALLEVGDLPPVPQLSADAVTPAQVEAGGAAAPAEPSGAQDESAEAAPLKVKDIHHDLLQRTLRDCGGNRSAAARRLGVSRGWIYRRLQTGDAEPPADD
jgi:transcriptional regulator of acetoin/glycerol metabolism